MIGEEHDKRINYFEIPVTDIEAAKSFFGSVFDWSFVDYGPQYSAFNDGALDGGFRLEETLVSGRGPLMVIFAVDLEATLERVKQHGGKIVEEIFSFPGGRRFHYQVDGCEGHFAVWSDRGIEED